MASFTAELDSQPATVDDKRQDYKPQLILYDVRTRFIACLAHTVIQPTPSLPIYTATSPTSPPLHSTLTDLI